MPDTPFHAVPAELHGVAIDFHTADDRIAARLQRQWAPFAVASTRPSIRVTLAAVAETPPPPQFPAVSEGPIVVYFRNENHLVAYFRRWGRYDVDLAAGTVWGAMTEACLHTYGIFEDMIIIALAPLLRRRGLYTIHAFAAAIDGRAAVLVGDIGAGKTTTGLSLLCAGAQLISNDSPLLRFASQDSVELCAYPGLLSTYPNSLAWFPQLQPVLARAERLHGSEKLSFALDDVWPRAWRQTAPAGALFFPQIAPGLTASAIHGLSSFQALQRLASQSIENWDTATMPDHLRALRLLAAAVPSFELRLAPDVQRLPDLITHAMAAT